jgi:hypothetical protein
MCCYGSSPILENVIFTANQAHYGGGLMSYGGAAPSLTGVTFRGNQSWDAGGGWHHEGGVVTVTDCTFYNNNCTGAAGGGGLYLRTEPSVLTGCTFAWNRAANGGNVRLRNGCSPTIENCIIAFSQNGEGLLADEGCEPVCSRVLIYGNDDGDDLAGTVSDTLVRDPRFCDVLAGDMTLCSNSWALPGNNPWVVQMGAYGSGCGDCETPVEETSWGALKALHR